MNHQRLAFRRKVIYLSAMAVLLVPLSLWGLPAKSAVSRDEKPKPFLDTVQDGRVLANLRYQNHLAQGNLGDIDPGSETVKFATLGFRGLAATILWSKARQYQLKENWTGLRDVLDDIARLQPNFVGVWRYQGWNVAYNVSAEWDDYRYRYYWVVKGIEYLDEGQRYNDRDTRLLWDESWNTGYKIGRSDEYRQFRELFRRRAMGVDVPEPRYPPRGGPRGERDNWLYAKSGFQEALDLHQRGIELRGQADDIFYAEPPKCQIRFTEAWVEEGSFGAFASAQWNQALKDWRAFGRIPFESVSARSAEKIFVSMGDEELHKWQRIAKERIQQLDVLGGLDEKKRTIRQRLVEERRAKLTDDVRAAMEKDFDERSDEEHTKASQGEARIRVAHIEVANEIQGADHAKAVKLARQIAEAADMVRRVEVKRQMLNYAYWQTRCEAEASPMGIAARELLFQARQNYAKDSGSVALRKSYERAFAKWRELYDKYPELVGDGDVGDDLVEEFRRYADNLNSTGAVIDPEKFILKDVIEARQPSPPIRWPKASKTPKQKR